MAINSEIRDQAYLFFVEEVPELLQTIESGLLTLSQDRSTANVHNLMRAAHSLKGGSAGVGLQAIATLAHRLETIFRACYSDTLTIDTELEDRLLQAFDCLRFPLIEQIETGTFDAEQTLAIAEPIFSAIEAHCGDALNQSESYIPSSADLGIDMVTSILEVDVDQGLRRLQAVVANPQDYEVAGELRALAEVLAGFGEILNLPCFEEIAAIARQALDQYPDRALEITQLALADFDAARRVILAGNRTPAHPVSPELASLATSPAAQHPATAALDAPPETPTVGQDFHCPDEEAAEESFEVLLERLEAELSVNNHFDAQAAAFADNPPGGNSPGGQNRDRHGFAREPITAIEDDSLAWQAAPEAIADTNFDAADFDNPGFDDPGFDDPGFDNPAYNDLDFDTPDFDIRGLDTPDFDAADFDDSGFDDPGFDDPGFDDPGFDDPGFDDPGFNNPGFDNPDLHDLDFDDLDFDSADFDADDLAPESLSLDILGDRDLEPDAIEALLDPDPPDLEDAQPLDLAPLDADDPEDPTPFLLLLEEEADPDPPSRGTAEGDRGSPPASLSEATTQRPSPPVEETRDHDANPETPLILEATVRPIEQSYDDLPAASADPSTLSAAPQPPAPANGSKGGSLVLSPRPLPPLSPAQPQQLSARPTLGRSPSAQRRDGTATPHLTTRVDSQRLERMDKLVGELSINRDSLSLQNEQLRGVLRELLSRFGRFRGMANYFRDLADQAIVAADRPRQTVWSDAAPVQQRSQIVPPLALQGQPPPPLEHGDFAASDFDPLEMDRYGTLHSRLQEMLEEIVQLEESVNDVTLFAQQSDQALEKQRHTLARLRDELTWARMLPLGEILNRFPRILRDLATTYHKPVELKLTGTGVLVEKAILEKLYDPLLHLLRNAFDHGIEPQFVRQRLGKPQKGQIEIRAYHKGNQTVVEVKDDGQGLNLDQIRNRALEMGRVSTAELAGMMPADLFQLIFEPGFSTARQVSELSGRGIGLDVVQAQLEAVKGTVAVSSVAGQGTTFTLHLPLTLTIVKLIICLVGTVPIALPADGVEEVLTPQADQLKRAGGQRFFHWQKQMIPVYRLANLLDYSCLLPDTLPSKALTPGPYPKNWLPPLLILHQGGQICALEVDRLVNEQEMVIKPFGSILKAPSYTYGCTILGDGNLIPVIDGLALLEHHLERLSENASPVHAATPLGRRDRPTPPSVNGMPPVAQSPIILVVDDAIALRRTLALSLEKSGFRVIQARDGQEAIDRLEQSTLPVSLIVCDIEMPNMNGFEFLSYRRQTPFLAKIPVVMLTSRSNDKHRWLAMQLGANAYFTKPYLEQEFLSTLRNILD